MSFYYIYKISQGPGQVVKTLEKIDQFNTYKDAKKMVKTLRLEQSSEDSGAYKIIFAESELDAEEKLQEKREAPVVEEWEK